jgi:hypothetical protein
MTSLAQNVLSSLIIGTKKIIFFKISEILNRAHVLMTCDTVKVVSARRIF